ncbi:MAG: PQQ-binding-like beta-propeller repeat protein [Alphaproteobacteria bacterium]|nr:PQQ-binding-like beta-propeller repeat protein [Alphaproteobacteria bacterium]
MPALAQETVLEPGWEHYGGDEGGTRYSPADDITPANVGDLEEAWVYRTGDLDTKADAVRRSAFEGTPILIDGRLIVCTPFNEVVALHPASGEQLWRYDPKIDLTITYANQYVCRGLVAWRDPLAPLSSECATRLFMGTNDRRLIALDAKTGKPCSAFGASGIVPIDPGMALLYPGEFQITSPPIVVRGVVIVGSSIGDNARAEAPSGVVRAFDAHSGAPLWTFDPIARSDNAPNAESWLGDSAKRSGHANVWAPMSGDEARGLVFLPTSSPSPDFYGGIRPGDNSYANSVVALDAETGAVAWSFQTVHHDIWDYDIPAQPTLARVAYQGSDVDAVIQATKQGLIFTLDRDTGTPVIPVEERPVPQEAALGEWVSATQPFPVAPAMLVPDRMTPDDAYGLTWLDASECRAKIEGARAEGLYTPPSEQGTLPYPFSGGGVNWGGLAFDPQRQIVIVNTSSALHKITLIRREDFAAAKRAQPQLEISAQAGTPFGMKRELLRSDTIGMPCNPPPWGMLHAIDMRTGSILWQVPFGTTADLVWFSDWVLPEGTPNFGGPIVTASGLVFIGAAMDNYLRAYDVQSGKELWRGRLPAGGQATPMTYVYEGKQYVVIAAGGHSRSTTTLGDSIVAFRLPN